jgi:hypothetical protein
MPVAMMLLAVAWTQAAYFLLTGLWPLVDVRSFQAVTGPKTDLWLVHTVGVLVAAVAVPIGLAAHHRRVTPEIGVLAVGAALGLAAVDVAYVVRRVIRPVYLLDAAAGLALVAGWAVAWAAHR